MNNFSALEKPAQKAKVILDTDTYNEIDDQFAVAYALRSENKIEVLSIGAAPFFNARAKSPAEGMEKSCNEIFNILRLMGIKSMDEKVFRGSTEYLPDVDEPVDSPAARNIIKTTHSMPEGERLYIIAMGAATNISSALLLDPSIDKKITVIWLCGNAHHWQHNLEFNCAQDIPAAKILFDSGVPLVQFPCAGVADRLAVTEPELRHHLKGKNPLCDYLYEITCEHSANYAKRCDTWSKVIWDIAPVAWLVCPNCTDDVIINSPIVTAENTYSQDTSRHQIKYIRDLNRDKIFGDLFKKLTR